VAGRLSGERASQIFASGFDDIRELIRKSGHPAVERVISHLF